MSDPRPPESESPPQIRDTEPAPAPDTSDETTNPRGSGLIDDPAWLAAVALYEQGLDARFASMERAVICHLRDLLDVRFRQIESALRLQSQLLERWAEDAMTAVTRVDQIQERLALVEARLTVHCASSPPNGG